MIMYVPSIGDKIKLTNEWEFPIFFESRNKVFLQVMRPDLGIGENYREFWGREQESVMVKLPAETILRVDRIYIRKGKGEWDSITFCVGSAPGIKFPTRAFGSGGRFWAKLVDVNGIEFERVVEQPKSEKTNVKVR